MQSYLLMVDATKELDIIDTPKKKNLAEITLKTGKEMLLPYTPDSHFVKQIKSCLEFKTIDKDLESSYLKCLNLEKINRAMLLL